MQENLLKKTFCRSSIEGRDFEGLLLKEDPLMVIFERRPFRGLLNTEYFLKFLYRLKTCCRSLKVTFWRSSIERKPLENLLFTEDLLKFSYWENTFWSSSIERSPFEVLLLRKDILNISYWEKTFSGIEKRLLEVFEWKKMF